MNTQNTPNATATVATLNKDEEIRLAIGTAKDYVQEKAITMGITGPQHAGIMTRVVTEFLSEIGVELELPKVRQLFTRMAAVENGSALRQKLEAMQVLTVQPKGGKSIDTDSMI